MIGNLNDVEPLVIVASILICAVGAVLLLRASRRVHARRQLDMDLASELLDAHFAAAKTVLEDVATPETIRRFMRTFSVAVGRRDVAQKVAQSISDHDHQPQSPSDAQKAMIETTLNDLKDLKSHRPDLVDALGLFVSSGFVAMMIRWPETAQAAMQAMAQNVERNGKATMVTIRDQSTRVLSSTQDLVPRLHAVPA